MYWTYGLDDSGTAQLLGPFQSPDEADDAGADLNGVRVVSAQTRNDAIAQLQRQPQRRSRLKADEPRGGIAQDAADIDREYEEASDL
jgi:hypothetical protein